MLLSLLAVSATVTAAALTVGETLAVLTLASVEAGWFAELPFLDAHPVTVVAVSFGVVAPVLLVARRLAASVPILQFERAPMMSRITSDDGDAVQNGTVHPGRLESNAPPLSDKQTAG